MSACLLMLAFSSQGKSLCEAFGAAKWEWKRFHHFLASLHPTLLPPFVYALTYFPLLTLHHFLLLFPFLHLFHPLLHSLFRTRLTQLVQRTMHPSPVRWHLLHLLFLPIRPARPAAALQGDGRPSPLRLAKGCCHNHRKLPPGRAGNQSIWRKPLMACSRKRYNTLA